MLSLVCYIDDIIERVIYIEETTYYAHFSKIIILYIYFLFYLSIRCFSKKKFRIFNYDK